MTHDRAELVTVCKTNHGWRQKSGKQSNSKHQINAVRAYNSMFGDRAIALLKELRSLAHLPLYNVR